jgi:two-component system OmpR family response regulator
VIMLTAKSLEADRALAFTAGADDWVTKPFDPAELVSRVKRRLRMGRARRLPDTRLRGAAARVPSDVPSEEP